MIISMVLLLEGVGQGSPGPGWNSLKDKPELGALKPRVLEKEKKTTKKNKKTKTHAHVNM